MQRRTASGAGSASRRPSTSWASLLSVASRVGASSSSRGKPGETACVRQRRHQPIPVQGKWLRQVVKGYFNYHAVPTNNQALAAFHFFVTELWQRSLRRRSQKDGTTWAQITQLAKDWLPKPDTLHPWPRIRFAVTHPRWEPYAGKPHVRFCAGGAQQ